jgi:peptide/nickel transport system ATP-binding protein
MSEKDTTLIEMVNVDKSFVQGRRTTHVLRGMNLTIGAGEIVALVGESGSGKSTVARMLMRLYEPDHGQLRFAGQDVGHIRGKELKEYRRHIQMLFQDPFASLNPTQTVRTILERSFLREVKAEGRSHVEETLMRTLNEVELSPPENFLSKYPHELSGGQRQRVAFARALGVHPQLMIADEPVSMLDVSLRLGVLNLMRGLNQSQGLAYLYITHDLASARYVASRILVMYAGQVVESGSAESVVERPQHPYTQLLVSAAPDPDQRGKRDESVAVKGEPPDLSQVIRGCPFQFRCPHVFDTCRTVEPAMIAVAENQWARCHLFNESKQPAVGG